MAEYILPQVASEVAKAINKALTSVQTVNGKAPDANGNVVVEGGSGGLLTIETITIGEDSGGGETVAVTGLTLDLASYNAKVGDGFYINPVVTPNNATNKAVTWKSNATNIATVDNSGYVECIAEGDATITCTTVDGGFTATCAVSVAATESGGGEDSGGGTTGGKVQFSTLELNSGSVKAGGAVASGASERYVVIPYTEGMYIKTLWNAAWSIATYPAIQVVTNETYSTPNYDVLLEEDGTTKQIYTIGGKLPNIIEATLTGYASGSTVVVNMLIGNAKASNMDASDHLYYIAGGEA